MNTQIIAIANQKGGVGKTTTCANLGIGLAQAGKKVLLIDGDPQGSLTISLGHPQPDKLPFTLSDAMGRILMDEPLRPGEGILHHPEGVDLMPADIQLSGMEVSLVNAMSRETILRQYLDTLKGQYSHSAMLKELVGTYQAIKGTEYLFSPSHEVVGKCPRCGGEVAEMQKGFFCQTESCKFAIWKNNKWWEMKHKQPTKAIVTALLKDGRAHVRGLYSEKTGKTYDATVVLADDGQYANFKLEFDQQKGGKR